MKKLIALLMVALMIFSCGAAFADGYEIVVVPKDASNPWFVRMETGVNEYAEAHLEDTIYQKGTPEIDPTLQYQLVMDLVAQGVDAICVVPVDLESIEPALKAAREAGIVLGIVIQVALRVEYTSAIELLNFSGLGSTGAVKDLRAEVAIPIDAEIQGITTLSADNLVRSETEDTRL